jgi:proton-translocating NADH-quinone oxidoreductase chain M
MAFLNHWLLTILLLVPMAGAVAVLFVRPPRAVRWTALGTTLAAFCLSLVLLIPFRSQRTGAYGYGSRGTVQLLCQFEWLPAIHGYYKVALDGLSNPLVVFTTIICVVACAASFRVGNRPRVYFSLLLFFEATTLGIFLAFDVLFFCGFLVLSLIPAYLLIARSGGIGSQRAAKRFLLYMLASLACLFVALYADHLASRTAFPGGTFDLIGLTSRDISGIGKVLFLLAAMGFLIRLPVVPLHGWLPDVMAESSGPVAAVVGALVPLTGGYGLLRIAWPLFSAGALSIWSASSILAVFSILFGSLRAIAEQDLKRSIAYASTSITGFVLLGIAVTTPTAMNGAVFVLLSQGLILAIMAFLLDRNAFASDQRLATEPARGTFFVIACLAATVVPGLLGQLIVLLGVFQAARPDSLLGGVQHLAGPGYLYFLAMIASLGVVLIGVWVAGVIRRTFSLPTDLKQIEDLAGRETSYLVPLAIVTLMLGLFPMALCFTFTQRAVDAILKSLG